MPGGAFTVRMATRLVTAPDGLLAGVPGIDGTTLLGDGRVLLVSVAASPVVAEAVGVEPRG